MAFLSIDTTSTRCEVGLRHKCINFYTSITEGLKSSEKLLPVIHELLKENNLNIHDIKGIVVNIGPGSFTGIRVGISVTKALGQSLNIKIMPVSGLYALAFKAFEIKGWDEKFLSVPFVDALRDQVYASAYTCSINKIKQISKNTIASKNDIDNFMELAKKQNKNIIFIGEKTKASSIINYIDELSKKQNFIEYINLENEKMYLSDTLLNIAEILFDSQAINYNLVSPLYIRNSAAEDRFNK